MRQYLVRFTKADGNCDSKWCLAFSERHAESVLRDKYPYVKNVELITEIK